MTRYTYILPLLLIIFVFIADLMVPKDIAVHILYLAAVALATKTHRYSLALLISLCTSLILFRIYVSDSIETIDILNRGMTITALITVGWLGEQIVSAMQASKEDQLTKIYNRRGIEAERSIRETQPTAAILIDLDDFKRVNDTWGLLSGDLVLKEVADMLTTVARNSDIVGRWGGDEFLVLLWDAKWSDTQKIAERFYRMLSNARVEVNADGAYTRISASIGVVQLAGDTTLGEAVKIAQDALSTSKSNGKNTITFIESSGIICATSGDDLTPTSFGRRKPLS